MLNKEEKDTKVMEEFKAMTGNWASDVINSLLTAKINSTDIPKGYALTGVDIKDGYKDGSVEILFSFRREDK